MSILSICPSFTISRETKSSTPTLVLSLRRRVALVPTIVVRPFRVVSCRPCTRLYEAKASHYKLQVSPNSNEPE